MILIKKKIIKIDVKDVSRVSFFLPLCFEHSLISYCKTLDIDIYKAFVSAINFEYNDDSIEKFGNKIDSGYDIFAACKTYSNVQIIRKDVRNEELIKNINHRIEQETPIIIHLDTYYSFWGRLYKKEHSDHVAIVCGQVGNDSLYIIDPDFNNEPMIIPISLLKDSSSFYFQIDVDNSIKNFNYINTLKKYLECNNSSFYLKKIKKFADDILLKFNPNIEFDDATCIECILHSEFIRSIRNIICGRNLNILFYEEMYETLEYEKKFIAKEIINYIYISIGKWNTIMNLLFKATRTYWPDNINYVLANIIKSILEVEQTVVLNAKKLCGIKEHKLISQEVERTNIKQEIIELSEYYNNKGFGTKIGAYYDLTLAGEYFIYPNSLDMNLKLNNVNFKLNFNKRLDNIICYGQKIGLSVPSACIGMAIIACSEWGDCTECIGVTDINKVNSIYMIKVNDLSKSNECNSVIKGSTVFKESVVNKNAALTFLYINFINIIDIINIDLPMAPNLHIIAITLIKVDML